MLLCLQNMLQHPPVAKRMKTHHGDSSARPQQGVLGQTMHHGVNEGGQLATVQLCGEGQVGEVAVAGLGLAVGYHRYSSKQHVAIDLYTSRCNTGQ